MRKCVFLFSLLGCALLFTQFKFHNSPTKVLPKGQRENFAWIPGGNAVTGKDTSKVDGFFISKMEVSQGEYNEFLKALSQKDEATKLSNASIDTAGWSAIGDGMAPYTKYYHSHPAYSNYPVVNIGYEAAILYCSWLEEKLETEMGVEYNVEATLPSRAEWIRAARGDKHFYKYAWGGSVLRNARGCALCNYRNIGDEAISRNATENGFEVIPDESGSIMGVAGYLSDNAAILAPVHAYSANDFGVFNMNGNAREMTYENGLAVGGSWRDPGYDVRNESTSNYTGPSPDLGFRPIFRIIKK